MIYRSASDILMDCVPGAGRTVQEEAERKCLEANETIEGLQVSQAALQQQIQELQAEVQAGAAEASGDRDRGQAELQELRGRIEQLQDEKSNLRHQLQVCALPLSDMDTQLQLLLFIVVLCTGCPLPSL